MEMGEFFHVASIRHRKKSLTFSPLKIGRAPKKGKDRIPRSELLVSGNDEHESNDPSSISSKWWQLMKPPSFEASF